MIQKLEMLVRAGDFAVARKHLRETSFAKVPRPELLGYANLARRLDFSQLSLKILSPVVHPEGRRGAHRSPPTPAELIEYAASLRNLGATREAQEILGGLDRKANPQAGFQLALCHISEWRYSAALPLLRDYAGSFAQPCYALQVARVNLIEAWIRERCLPEAEQGLAELQAEIGGFAEAPLLFRKCLELAALLEIAREEWGRAITLLEEARSLLGADTESIHALFLAKWLAVARSTRAGKVLPELLRLREDVRQRKAWATLRDCDFCIARLSRDEKALIRLHFGTPYESYRQDILAALGDERVLPERYLWSGHADERSGPILDLARAELELKLGGSYGPKVEAGQAVHRLLITLSQDFYRATPLLSVFSKLFPGEYFDPSSSPNRVHQILKRARQWMREARLPLEIEQEGGSYRLGFTGPLRLSIPRGGLPLEAGELELLQLRLRLGGAPFTAAQALGALGTSRTSVHRLLKWALGHGMLRCSGQARRTRYEFERAG